MRWLQNLFKRFIQPEKPAKPPAAFSNVRGNAEGEAPRPPVKPPLHQPTPVSEDDFAARQAHGHSGSGAGPMESPARPAVERSSANERPQPADDDFIARQARARGIDIEKRQRRAAESLLEDEALTSDLDDAAAQTLLQWGTRLAKAVANATLDLDDVQAEAVLGQRLRATRQMMRAVNKWAAAQASLDASGKAALLGRIQEQMKVVFGEQANLPDQARLDAFLKEQPAGSPAQVIAQLRQLFDRSEVA